MKEKLDYPLALMVCMFKPPISTNPASTGGSPTPKPLQDKVQGINGKKIKVSGRVAMACRKHSTERP